MASVEKQVTSGQDPFVDEKKHKIPAAGVARLAISPMVDPELSESIDLGNGGNTKESTIFHSTSRCPDASDIDQILWRVHPLHVLIGFTLLKVIGWVNNWGIVIDIFAALGAFCAYSGLMAVRTNTERLRLFMKRAATLEQPVKETLESYSTLAKMAQGTGKWFQVMGRLQLFIVSLIGAKLLCSFMFYLAEATTRFFSRRNKEEAIGIPVLRYMAHSLCGLAKIIAFLIGAPFDIVAKSVKDISETCIDLVCLFGFTAAVNDGKFMEACNSALNDAFYMKTTGPQTRWDEMKSDERLRYKIQERMVMSSQETVKDGKVYINILRQDYPCFHDYCAFYDKSQTTAEVTRTDRILMLKELMSICGLLGFDMMKNANATFEDRLVYFAPFLKTYVDTKSNDATIFYCAIQGAAGNVYRKDILSVDLVKYAERVLQHRTTQEVVSGEEIKTAFHVDPLPCWGGIDLPDVGRHWSKLGYGQKYKFFVDRATNMWDRFVEYSKTRKWLVPVLVFGVATLYLLYHIWQKKKERKVRFQSLPDFSANEDQSDFKKGEKQTPTMEDVSEHHYSKKKSGHRTQREIKSNTGPSHYLGKDNRNLKGQSVTIGTPLPAVMAMLHEESRKLKSTMPSCLRCLNQWSCKIDENKHKDEKFCSRPSLDKLRSLATGAYKDYINSVTRLCICGGCNGETIHRRRALEYEVDRVRLGLPRGTHVSEKQSLTLKEYEAPSGMDIRTYNTGFDDDYIVMPIEDLIESQETQLHSFIPNDVQAATFNHVSFDSNALFSTFMIEIVCLTVSLSSDEQWSDLPHSSRAHGFRSSLGYQTVRHLFGDHHKIKLQKLSVYFYLPDCGVTRVDVPIEDLSVLSDHYNLCMSGNSLTFTALDLWVIPQREWALSVGKHMPMKKDNNRYELSTVGLWTNQEFANALGVIPKYKPNTRGSYEMDFAPFCFQCVENDTDHLDARFRVGVYWADTVKGDSGCLIMVGGVAICQHLRTGNEPDGRVCGRFFDDLAKNAMKAQLDRKLVNSC